MRAILIMFLIISNLATYSQDIGLLKSESSVLKNAINKGLQHENSVGFSSERRLIVSNSSYSITYTFNDKDSCISSMIEVYSESARQQFEKDLTAKFRLTKVENDFAWKGKIGKAPITVSKNTTLRSYPIFYASVD
jgi:hypothetical protein